MIVKATAEAHQVAEAVAARVKRGVTKYQLCPEATSKTSAADEVARRKLALLQLAGDLDDVSRAYNATGYSRQQFQEFQENVQT